MASPRTDAVVAEPEAEPEPAAAAAPKGILAGPHSAPKVGTGEREQDLRKIQSCPPRVSTSILKTPDQSGLRRAQSAPLKFTEVRCCAAASRSPNSTLRSAMTIRPACCCCCCLRVERGWLGGLTATAIAFAAAAGKIGQQHNGSAGQRRRINQGLRWQVHHATMPTHAIQIHPQASAATPHPVATMPTHAIQIHPRASAATPHPVERHRPACILGRGTASPCARPRRAHLFRPLVQHEKAESLSARPTEPCVWAIQPFVPHAVEPMTAIR